MRVDYRLNALLIDSWQHCSRTGAALRYIDTSYCTTISSKGDGAKQQQKRKQTQKPYKTRKSLLRSLYYIWH